MKKLIVSLFLFSALPVMAAGLSASDIRDLLDIESGINSYCRGISPDADPTNHPALCGDETQGGARDKIIRILNHQNWCYGKKGQAGFEKEWHKCTTNSER